MKKILMTFVFCLMPFYVFSSQNEPGVIDSILTPSMIHSIIAKTEQVIANKMLLRLCGSGFKEDTLSVQDYRNAWMLHKVSLRLDSKITISGGIIEPVTLWQKIVDPKNPAKTKYVFLFIGDGCSPKITVNFLQEDEELFFRQMHERRLQKQIESVEQKN